MSFQDHFSGHAADYAKARPGYPDSLFDWLASLCNRQDLVWDAGCGNGQASLALARRFQRVHATDPSAAQLAAAPEHPRIAWRNEPAEACSLPDHSADLVTVAQAFHWFDQGRFAAEVRRVAVVGAPVAVWSYALCSVTDAVDLVIGELYGARLGRYWPPERRHVETAYRDLPFPFQELHSVPRFEMRCDWTLPQFTAYLRSWSAAQRHLQDTGRDAVTEVTAALVSAWGDPMLVRPVRWPLGMRVGRCP